MTFDLFALRFHFTACGPLHFPRGKAGNILRGSLGRVFKKLACAPKCTDARQCSDRTVCAYALLFEPASAAGQGPSGLHDWPRPFVFRAAHLDGVTVASGGAFHFGLNLFETGAPAIDHFRRAFAEMAREGLGPGRTTAVLQAVEGDDPLRLPLSNQSEARRARVRFLTPTELKGAVRPEFSVLFARIRDRASTLRALYGAGPLEVDFKALGERAAAIRMTRCDLQQIRGAERLSGRTGQRHSLGGFVGVAEYEGDLGEFMPYLEIARWTGVGRQTVWGKGEIACEAF